MSKLLDETLKMLGALEEEAKVNEEMTGDQFRQDKPEKYQPFAEEREEPDFQDDEDEFVSDEPNTIPRLREATGIMEEQLEQGLGDRQRLLWNDYLAAREAWIECFKKFHYDLGIPAEEHLAARNRLDGELKDNLESTIEAILGSEEFPDHQKDLFKKIVELWHESPIEPSSMYEVLQGSSPVNIDEAYTAIRPHIIGVEYPSGKSARCAVDVIQHALAGCTDEYPTDDAPPTINAGAFDGRALLRRYQGSMGKVDFTALRSNVQAACEALVKTQWKKTVTSEGEFYEYPYDGAISGLLYNLIRTLTDPEEIEFGADADRDRNSVYIGVYKDGKCINGDKLLLKDIPEAVIKEVGDPINADQSLDDYERRTLWFEKVNAEVSRRHAALTEEMKGLPRVIRISGALAKTVLVDELEIKTIQNRTGEHSGPGGPT